jgi:ribosomal protein S18 acetylase RimI-like enzyme
MTYFLIPPQLHVRLGDQLAQMEPLAVGASSLLRLEPYRRQFWLVNNKLIGVRNQQVFFLTDIVDPPLLNDSFWKHYQRKKLAFFGLPQWLQPWEKLFGVPWRWMDYYFMVLPVYDHQRYVPNPKLSIRQARPTDLNILWPLQANYEIEEVIFEPSDFHEESLKFLFKRTLKQELHWYLSVDNQAVCKVSTNAQGFNWIQLGGVYTQTAYRRYKFATHLMSYVIDYFHQQHKGICLFVKKSNTPAFNLYKSLGFQILSDYRIVYYQEF